MNARENNCNDRHGHGSQPLDSASRPYLVEAALDREWEENYLNGESPGTAHGSRTSSRPMRTEEGEARSQEGGRV
jgi:hypothetical protein